MRRKILCSTTTLVMVFGLVPVAPLGAMAGEDAPMRALATLGAIFALALLGLGTALMALRRRL